MAIDEMVVNWPSACGEVNVHLDAADLDIYMLLLQASKKMLMETDFLQSLRAFDKDHIPPPVVQRIKPYIANPEFEPNKILTVSHCEDNPCCKTSCTA